MRVLVVDDEEMIVEFLRRALAADGHAVEIAYDGTEAVGRALSRDYDAIVLDVMMPEKDGLAVCREIREQGISTPVLILSTLQTAADRVSGLDSGADDYLIKPFTYEELAARLRALLRRPRELVTSRVVYGDIVVYTGKRTVTQSGKLVEITPKEYDFLEYLCLHQNRAVSKEELLANLWGATTRNASNRVEVCVRSLRDKLDHAGEESFIQTVRGFGYTLRKLD